MFLTVWRIGTRQPRLIHWDPQTKCCIGSESLLICWAAHKIKHFLALATVFLKEHSKVPRRSFWILRLFWMSLTEFVTVYHRVVDRLEARLVASDNSWTISNSQFTYCSALLDKKLNRVCRRAWDPRRIESTRSTVSLTHFKCFYNLVALSWSHFFSSS